MTRFLFSKAKPPDGETAVSGVANSQVLLALGLAGAVLFWESLLHLILGVLHLAVEALELSFEHLVEAVFHLSPRDAQVVTAWTGLSLAVYLLWRGYVGFTRNWGAFKRRAVAHWVEHPVPWGMAVAAVVVRVVI